MTQDKKVKLHFIKCHAPWEVLLFYAEELNFRAPLEVGSLFATYISIIFERFRVDCQKRIQTVVWTRIDRCVFDGNENALVWSELKPMMFFFFIFVLASHYSKNKLVRQNLAKASRAKYLQR